MVMYMFVGGPELSKRQSCDVVSLFAKLVIGKEGRWMRWKDIDLMASSDSKDVY